MPIVEKIKISDEGISTLKKLRDEHRSFKDELKSTKKELQNTWDKKYKPVIENTAAVKSIKTIQKSADDMKRSLNAKVRLNDEDIRKLDAVTSRMKAFGKMVISPFVKIKGNAVVMINRMYQQMLRLGSMVIAPVVKLKDQALSKLKSSIKLFQDLGKRAIEPVIRLKDKATVKLKAISNTLGNIARKIAEPVIRLKDMATFRMKQIIGVLNRMKNGAVSIAVKIRDFASPKIKSIRNGLLFLGKLSIQPIVKVADLATLSIRKIRSGLLTLGKKSVSAVVNLKGNAVKQVLAIKVGLAGLTKKVTSPIVRLKDTASAKIKKITKEVRFLGKTIARPAVVLKDNITRKLSPITSRLKAVGGKTYKATITAINKTASGVSSALKTLGRAAKKVVIPVTVAATVTTAALGAAVKSGMTLENQQVSIEHFIGATNKDYGESQIKKAAQSFTEQLRQNANATPFETGEVIAAGSRAIAITQGNTKSAMDLVKLAEDMAAASGGTKSVSDAIEALADAKLGEMERLKEFGFKVSADEFEQKGFKGVSKDLQDFYGGAASKLATTGSGLLSTITGKLKSGVSDFGLKIVEQLKPVLAGTIDLIDKVMPHIQNFGTVFGDSIGKGIRYISQIMPSFINGFKQMSPTFQSLISGVQQMLPPIMAFGSTLIGTIQNVVVQAAPVVEQIVQAIARILPAVQPIFSQIITTVGNIVTTVLPPLGTAFSTIADVIVAIAPVVSETFSIISGAVTTAISGISSVIQGGLDLISSMWSGSWQGCVDAFGTIFGGIAEICKSPINAVISVINGAIDAINSISVDVPDWVPVVGGQHWGLNLGHIPMLAKGGVVNQATTAVIGEAGKEAVMPLERNTGWISQLAGQLMGRMSGFGIQLPTMMQPIPIGEGNTGTPKGKTMSVVITIAKLADQIIVEKEEDIDKTAEAVAEKLLEVVKNM